MNEAVIRTSDRQLFKRCRRKWDLTSALRKGYEGKASASYFWLGTMGHYALQDYHGYNYYKHPAEAFKAAVEAYTRWTRQPGVPYRLPDDWESQRDLGVAIMDYYLTWLKHRDPLKTLWVGGVPQCELRIVVELPMKVHPEIEGYDRVVYAATLDRVVEIEGELWIVDYKFYKKFWGANLDFDQQMSAYIWAANTLYDRPVAGAILHQFLKKVPGEPRVLSNGRISADAQQGTTYHMYKETLEGLYGDVTKAPLLNRKCLEELAGMEDEDRDAFIWRNRTTRTSTQCEATGTQILMEARDMLNPDIPVYKNETKDCSWECSLGEVCMMIDRDDDWESALLEDHVSRGSGEDGWMNYLPTREEM